MKKVWVLMEDDLNEAQTANEHLVGVFTNSHDVIKEMRAQANFHDCELVNFGGTGTFIYADLDKDGCTMVVLEASLEEVDLG